MRGGSLEGYGGDHEGTEVIIAATRAHFERILFPAEFQTSRRARLNCCLCPVSTSRARFGVVLCLAKKKNCRYILESTCSKSFYSQLTLSAAPGLPCYTASAGHLMMPLTSSLLCNNSQPSNYAGASKYIRNSYYYLINPVSKLP